MGDVEKWVEDLLGKLTEEKFLSFLEDFTESHCGKFEEGEQKLEYTEIHQQVRVYHVLSILHVETLHDYSLPQRCY